MANRFRNRFRTGEAGPNLIINGMFVTDTDWDKGDGWTISGGDASCDGTQVAVTLLSQVILRLLPAQKYIVKYDVLDYVAGQVGPVLGATLGIARMANGSFEESIVTTGGHLFTMDGSATFVGSVDNISVEKST